MHSFQSNLQTTPFSRPNKRNDSSAFKFLLSGNKDHPMSGIPDNSEKGIPQKGIGLINKNILETPSDFARNLDFDDIKKSESVLRNAGTIISSPQPKYPNPSEIKAERNPLDILDDVIENAGDHTNTQDPENDYSGTYLSEAGIDPKKAKAIEQIMKRYNKPPRKPQKNDSALKNQNNRTSTASSNESKPIKEIVKKNSMTAMRRTPSQRAHVNRNTSVNIDQSEKDPPKKNKTNFGTRIKSQTSSKNENFTNSQKSRDEWKSTIPKKMESRKSEIFEEEKNDNIATKRKRPLNTDPMELKANLQESMEQEKIQLQDHIDNLNREKTNLQNQVKTLRKTNAQSKKEIEQLQIQIHSLEEEKKFKRPKLDKDEESYDARKNFILKDQVIQLKKQNAVLKEAITSQKNLTVELESTINFLVDDINKKIPQSQSEENDISNENSYQSQYQSFSHQILENVNDPIHVRSQLLKLKKNLNSVQQNIKGIFRTKIKEKTPSKEAETEDWLDSSRNQFEGASSSSFLGLEEQLSILLTKLTGFHQQITKFQKPIDIESMLNIMKLIRTNCESLLSIGIGDEKKTLEEGSHPNYLHQYLKDNYIQSFRPDRCDILLKRFISYISPSLEKGVLRCSDRIPQKKKLKKFIENFKIIEHNLINEVLLRENELFLFKCYSDFLQNQLDFNRRQFESQKKPFLEKIQNSIYVPFQDLEISFLKNEESGDKNYSEFYLIFSYHYKNLKNAMESLLSSNSMRIDSHENGEAIKKKLSSLKNQKRKNTGKWEELMAFISESEDLQDRTIKQNAKQ